MRMNGSCYKLIKYDSRNQFFDHIIVSMVRNQAIKGISSY